MTSPAARQVNRAACASPAARSRSPLGDRMLDRGGDRNGIVGIGAHAPRRRSRRPSTRGRTRRRVCRRPSPRRSASRSPRNVTGRRRQRRRDRAWPAPRPRRSRGAGRAGRRARAALPSPRHPQRRAAASPSIRRCASASACRFLRGSSVATVRTYGAPRSAAAPSGVKTALTPRCRDPDPLCGDAEQLRHLSPRVGGVDEDHVARPRCVRVLARRAWPACASSSSPGSGRGRGRGSSSSGPRRAGPGYIQSVKWSTSNWPRNRSATGWAAMLHAVLRACEAGSGHRRNSTSSPSRADLIRPGPRKLVGANATISCAPARRLEQAAERAADVVADSGRGMRQRRDVEAILTARTQRR